MSDDGSPSYLPWVIGALVLVIGGAKVDAARPFVAAPLAVAGPLVPVLIGVKRLEGASLKLERAGSAVAWLTILVGEACVARGFFQVGALDGLMPLARVALYVTGVGALVVGALDARAGGKSRLGAYVGIAAGFAVYLSAHTDRDALAGVFGAFFVGCLLGGGAGLLLGELLGRALKRA